MGNRGAGLRRRFDTWNVVLFVRLCVGAVSCVALFYQINILTDAALLATRGIQGLSLSRPCIAFLHLHSVRFCCPRTLSLVLTWQSVAKPYLPGEIGGGLEHRQTSL